MNLINLDATIAFAVVMLLLSLQITVLVQMAIAVSNLRGRNLAWGIKRLLEQVDPGLQDRAADITKMILTHKSITHTSWLGARATAIRSEELIRIATELAVDPDSDVSEQAKQAKQAIRKTLGMNERTLVKLREAANDLAEKFPEEARQIRIAINRGYADAQKLRTGVGKWFDTVMDRTSESFALYSRMITVVIGALFVFTLHIDSLEIFHQISASDEIRARLTQAGDALVKDEDQIAATIATKPVASAALTALKSSLSDPEITQALGEIPLDLMSRVEGSRWLEQRLQQIPDTELRAKAARIYQQKFDDETKTWLSDLKQSADSVGKTLEESRLTIVPAPFPHRWYSPIDYIKNYWKRQRHLLGVTLTALFLSLGASFWFNALKQLTTLRPMLAGKVEAGKREGK